MAVKKVIRMGHPTLRQIAQNVSMEELHSPEFKVLLQDLYDTMKAEGGIGIAAPQINVALKVTLIELPEHSRYGDMAGTPLMIIINPHITNLDETPQGFWEGCLSVPGLRGYVERPRKVQVDYLNEKGEQKTIVAEDFLATVFQHELDHLFGKLYVDHIKDKSLLTYNEEFTEFHLQTKAEDVLEE